MQKTIIQDQLEDVDYKSFRHGTCEIRVGDIQLKEKILMGIEVMSAEAFLA